MALLSLPRHKRIARLSERVPRPDFDLSDLSELVDAAVEVGAKYRPIPRLARRRPRRRRTAGVLLLVALAGAMVFAYRWWRAQQQHVAQFETADRAGKRTAPVAFSASSRAAERAAEPAAAPAVAPAAPVAPVDSEPREAQHHEATASVKLESAPESAPAHQAEVSALTDASASEAPSPQSPSASRESRAEGSHVSTQEEIGGASASTAWTPSTQPRRPQGAGAASVAHPRWGFGRGPSAGTPLMPSSRPAIPARPRPHLPR